MVIKTPIIQCGWSYGNGDDQYDNESVGSTKPAINPEKKARKLKKHSQNEKPKKMCNKQYDKHTNDQGWTTIEAKDKRKPKLTISKHTIIDSIISSIDIEFNIDKNGTLEATIDSPVRENRCTIPDTKDNKKDIAFKPNKQGQRILSPPMIDEEEKENTENTRQECTENKNYKKEKENKGNDEDQRNNKQSMNSRKNTTNNDEMMRRTETTDKATTSKETGVTTMAINGHSEDNQINANGGPNNNNNNNNDNSKNIGNRTEQNNTHTRKMITPTTTTTTTTALRIIITGQTTNQE
jgi:hypothetical protein